MTDVLSRQDDDVVDPSYRCPECGDNGELHGQLADDRTEYYYVCAVCSGAFSTCEVEPE